MTRSLPLLILLSGLLLSFSPAAHAQTGAVEGTVTDAETGEPLPGVNVLAEGTTLGTTTDSDGMYDLADLPAGEQMLVVSYIGYDTGRRAITIPAGGTVVQDFALAPGTTELGEVLVTGASRRAEKITDAPATIQAVTSAELEQLPGVSYEQAFARMKGVDFVRTGVTGVGINARGFNSAFNTKVLLLTDGRRSTFPGNGLPFANMNPVIKEDVERLEVILGPSSALYGPNAANAVVNTITKDPREHQETIAVAEGGLGDDDASLYSGRLWHGQTLAGGRLGLKVFGEYTGGQDYDFVDTTYSGNVALAENPDDDIQHIRAGAGLYYGLGDNTDLVANYNFSHNNFVTPNNIGHNQIKDWRVQQAQLRFSSPRFFAEAYGTFSNSGETFSLNNEAVFKAAGMNVEAAREAALFLSTSNRYNAEAQYNDKLAGVDFILGADFEQSYPQSDGTFLSDTTSSALSFARYGSYAQLERSFGPLKAVLAGRLDHQENYGEQFSPKAGLVYDTGLGNVRATYGQAFVAPTPLQQEIFVPAGTVPDTDIPIVVRGNGQGFTVLNDPADPSAGTTEIDPVEPELVRTFEVGYKGVPFDNLYFSINGYRSFQDNFVSPLQTIGFTTARGDFQQDQAELVLTYRNFGEVVSYGTDLSAEYKVNDRLTLGATYSYFTADLDEETFDLNGDGELLPNEISLNTPSHKFSLTATARHFMREGLFGTVTFRGTSEYDFVSGVHFSADEQVGQRVILQDPNGNPIPFNFNRGPLGGFVTTNLTLGYQFTERLSASLSAKNLFNVEQREFVGSPSSARLVILGLRAEF